MMHRKFPIFCGRIPRNTVGIFYLAAAIILGATRSAPGSTISTVAGDGNAGYSGDGGVATNANLNPANEMFDVAADAYGNIYIADVLNNVVRKVSSTGIISTVAGTGTAGFSGDGGLATVAQFNSDALPADIDGMGVSVDAFGNIYISDVANQRIRKVDLSTGIINTVAGNGTKGFSGDGGPATAAALNDPFDLDFDSAGNFYIADLRNHRIRKVDINTGIITTIAGTSANEADLGTTGDGGPGTAAILYYPWSVAIDNSDNIYLVNEDRHGVRRIDASIGVISTVVGDGTQGFSGDGGQALSAQLNLPRSICIDDGTYLYISEKGGHRIRGVDLESYIITTIAGDGTAGFAGDSGIAINARLNNPHGLAWFGGFLYVADETNKRIRKIVAASTKSVSTDPDIIRYVPFASKYLLMILLGALGGWLVLRRH